MPFLRLYAAIGYSLMALFIPYILRGKHPLFKVILHRALELVPIVFQLSVPVEFAFGFLFHCLQNKTLALLEESAPFYFDGEDVVFVRYI